MQNNEALNIQPTAKPSREEINKAGHEYAELQDKVLLKGVPLDEARAQGAKFYLEVPDRHVVGYFRPDTTQADMDRLVALNSIIGGSRSMKIVPVLGTLTEEGE